MDSIEKLKNIFAQFPTVGSRTASRFVFYLMKLPKNQIDELVGAILELKNKIKFCAFCFNPFEPSAAATGEGQDNLCNICKDNSRNKNLLCIVKKEADLQTIENTKKYKGLYFILQGNFLSIKNSDNLNVQAEALRQRIINSEKFGIGKTNFFEIIIATNPTPDGISTSVLIERILKDIPNQNFKITHLAKGIPVGGELEYADEETLESAFEGRK